MIEYERKALQGVPDYRAAELLPKRSEYCLLIPVINEGARILTELGRAQTAGVDTLCDIVICDGGSTDGSMKLDTLQLYGVNTLLTKTGPGKQGAQLRMGIYFALNRGYKGVLTIDGNNKDSIEDVHKFIEKLQAGYDFVQGSRFIKGGKAVNTPLSRWLAVRFIHAPVISLAARHWFTDTTNAYRAYSRAYLTHPAVQPLRDIFPGYELLVKGALLRFLSLLIAQGKQQFPAETADTQRLKAVLQWISVHYAEGLRVADAAGVCSFSSSHFMRWFRQMTGQSFVAFLNEYRLNAAAEALHATDETVLTIASRCGFENLSYFNRAFKAHFGMTPREYRKK